MERAGDWPQQGWGANMNGGCLGVVRKGPGSAATVHRTALGIFFSGVIMVFGPREQFNPTTSAPAASSRWQVCAAFQPSRTLSSRWIAKVTTAGTFECFLIASSAIKASPPQEKVSATM